MAATYQKDTTKHGTVLVSLTNLGQGIGGYYWPFDFFLLFFFVPYFRLPFSIER